MLASPPIRRRSQRLRPTPTRITTTILVALALLFVLGVGAHDVVATLFIGGYLALVLATAIVMRGVRRHTAGWLGLRAARRALVVLLLLVCLALVASPAPTGASGPGSVFLLLIVLIGLNIALGRATQRIATAPDNVVDERQEQLRNRAHRLAYAVLVLTVGGVVLVADVASPQSRSWLQSSIGGGGLIAFLELLFVLPAMVMAFLDRGSIPGEVADAAVRAGPTPRARLAAVMLTVTFGLPLLLSLAVVAVPPSTTSHSEAPSFSPVPAQAPSAAALAAIHCREFFATTHVGLGLGASIPLHAQACWDGTRAHEDFGMNATDCLAGSSMMASVVTTLCRRTTAADGTLSFTYRAQVSPALLPFLHRDVTLEVVIDRNGRVAQFP